MMVLAVILDTAIGSISIVNGSWGFAIVFFVLAIVCAVGVQAELRNL